MTIKMARINGVWLWEVWDRDLTLIQCGSDPDFQWAAYAAGLCYMGVGQDELDGADISGRR